jgi:hypothetical protein
LRPEGRGPRDAGAAEEKAAAFGAIERIAGRDATHRFDGSQLLSMRRPCVYIWLRGEKVLYVGKGSNGMNRPLDPEHHRIRNSEIQKRDQLVVYECDPGEEAALERLLIAGLKPVLNGGEPDPVDSLLSLDEVAARLKLSKGTIYNWIGRAGEKEGVFRLGNRTRVDWNLFWSWLTTRGSSDTI